MRNGVQVVGGVLVALIVAGTAAIDAGTPAGDAASGRAPQAAGAPSGRTGQPPSQPATQPAGRAAGGGRGAVRPECVSPPIPAAECSIPGGINWPDPPLAAGPFTIETAVPQHRTVRVVVVTNTLNQPWSATWLP